MATLAKFITKDGKKIVITDKSDPRNVSMLDKIIQGNPIQK